jgi:hypothetical protein
VDPSASELPPDSSSAVTSSLVLRLAAVVREPIAVLSRSTVSLEASKRDFSLSGRGHIAAIHKEKASAPDSGGTGP